MLAIFDKTGKLVSAGTHVTEASLRADTGLGVDEAEVREITDADLAELTRDADAEAKGRLRQIDAAGARAARAVALAVAGGVTPDAADVARLAELEAEAVALRALL